MNIKNIFAFAVGAAIGSAVTWKLIKTKYEKLAQEEIESVKEVFSRHNNDEERQDELDREACADIIRESEYFKYMEGKAEKTEDVEDDDKPYVISPEEFGENGYKEISLSYYSDGILADERDEIIEDVESCVGFDSLSHFGEYEDDSVFVRNDRLKVDYEILSDQRKYSEVVKKTRSRSTEG